MELYHFPYPLLLVTYPLFFPSARAELSEKQNKTENQRQKERQGLLAK